MTIFEAWINGDYAGRCCAYHTRCHTCPPGCICRGLFNGDELDQIIFAVLAKPDAVGEAVARNHPGSHIRIQIDAPRLLAHLQDHAVTISRTVILGRDTN